MTTANQIVDGAAEELGVKTSETDLESDDFQIIFTRMNDMLSEWADSGLTPGFSEVISGEDTVEIPRNSVSAVKYNLAARSASAFQKIVGPELAALVRTTLAALESSSTFIGEVAYPDTLPTGSGNECHDTFINDRFFPQNKKGRF